MTFENISISLPTKLIEKIDKARGDVARSRFIARLLEQTFDIPQKERVKYV
jgi:metal-responsive CopG/Arc/MetJ family transcriptional regulator